MSSKAIEEALSIELSVLNDNPEYIEAEKKVFQIQDEMLAELSKKIMEPLKLFLPSLKSIKLEHDRQSFIPRYYRDELAIILDDGTPTELKYKGDGIKSLVAIAMLKDKKVESGASIIAIEEPESHLHPGAIHELVDVINAMSENSQVILTTHNPLFVQQNRISSNVIVNEGNAKSAKKIAEIRDVLGIWPSDNLRNAQYVLVVEGEDDKISLSKILPAKSDRVKSALQSNQLVIKPLGGAGNLTHDLADLKNQLCKYVVLLDNDDAGQDAARKVQSKNNGLLKDSELKFTICNGSPKAEFEDCLKPTLYIDKIKEEFSVDLRCKDFKGKEKWSDRVKNAFLAQGAGWNEDIEERVKLCVANCIPDDITKTRLTSVLITEKSGFIDGLILAIENMLG